MQDGVVRKHVRLHHALLVNNPGVVGSALQLFQKSGLFVKRLTVEKQRYQAVSEARLKEPYTPDHARSGTYRLPQEDPLASLETPLLTEFCLLNVSSQALDVSVKPRENLP
jgi:hypothetical protein